MNLLFEIISLNKPNYCRLVTVFINKIYVQMQVQEITLYTDNNIYLNNICLQIKNLLKQIEGII